MDQEAKEILLKLLKQAGVDENKPEKNRLQDLQQKILDFVGTDWNGGYLKSERAGRNSVEMELGLQIDSGSTKILSAIKALKDASNSGSGQIGSDLERLLEADNHFKVDSYTVRRK